MAQLSLLSSPQLSSLLRSALSWRPASIDSLMVSATNGAVLAYAFRNQDTPTMKEIRSLSTTTTTAYSVGSAEGDALVFEAQLNRALAVVVGIGERVLLAVHGKGKDQEKEVSGVNGTGGDEDADEEERDGEEQSGSAADAADAEDDDEHGDDQQEQQRVRADLEYVSEGLAAVLREELRGMRWPDDI